MIRTVPQCKQKLRDLKKAYRRAVYFDEVFVNSGETCKYEGHSSLLLAELRDVFEQEMCGNVEKPTGKTDLKRNQAKSKDNSEGNAEAILDNMCPVGSDLKVRKVEANSSAIQIQKGSEAPENEILEGLCMRLKEWETLSRRQSKEREEFYDKMVTFLSEMDETHPIRLV
jgi:hypothetical protein